LNELFLTDINLFNDIYKLDELIIENNTINLLLDNGIKWANRLSICLEGFTWIIKNKLLESSLFFKSRLKYFINSIAYFIKYISINEIQLNDNNLIFYTINEISKINNKRFEITSKILNFMRYLIENSMDTKDTFKNLQLNNIISDEFYDLLNCCLFNTKILGNDLEEKDVQLSFFTHLQKLLILFKKNEIFIDFKKLKSKIEEQGNSHSKLFFKTYQEINSITENTSFLNSIYILNLSGLLNDIIKFKKVNEYDYYLLYLNCLEKLKNNENPSFDLLIKLLIDICMVNPSIQEECWGKLLVLNYRLYIFIVFIYKNRIYCLYLYIFYIFFQYILIFIRVYHL